MNLISDIKIYNSLNFHSQTFCVWKEVLPETVCDLKVDYTSDSGSRYIFIKEGIYRISNHWGRVGNCYWRIDSLDNYKNQQVTVGYANWTDFYLNDEKSKLFYITVNFDSKQVTFNHKDSGHQQGDSVLKDAREIAKTIKVIKTVFTENNWAKHLKHDNFSQLQYDIINRLICSDRNFLEIKKDFY